MFQWGISPGGAYQYYFSPAFIAKPFGCFLTAYYGNGNVITAASYVELTAQYLRYQSRWANLTRQERRSRILYRNRPLAGDRTLEIKYRKL